MAKRPNSPKFHNFVPKEQLVEEGPIPTPEQQNKKILQSALIKATQEFMSKYQKQIENRAFEILREQGY